MLIVKEKQKNKTINNESSPTAIFLVQLEKKCIFLHFLCMVVIIWQVGTLSLQRFLKKAQIINS
jgi:hypothetical protein